MKTQFISSFILLAGLSAAATWNFRACSDNECNNQIANGISGDDSMPICIQFTSAVTAEINGMSLSVSQDQLFEVNVYGESADCGETGSSDINTTFEETSCTQITPGTASSVKISTIADRGSEGLDVPYSE